MKPLKPIVRVAEVMKSDVDIVDGMTTVTEALQNMKYPETRTIIVDKRHDDDEFGVVMFRDIAKRVLAPDLSPQRINMYEIMSKPVISVDPQMDVRYCTKLFDRFGLSRAPVIENGKIIGLVSYTDIVLKGVIGQD
ncbi:MAG: CBS domain-containing protein [Xanthomonadales bacterium]|jgi:predicted transcriptional regulator|nr:CBS domain-containing protein [Xanthomonadales bacterium]MDH3924775.1 CBS domain-containing protein [Xanthomonadales bacterium]MDH3939919.1 CBS domain-containing protein [Xanthomonadales bacterium]MDH4001507.1 CBS domain-containing protein [Xanthomonadales bacterium]